MAVYSKTVQATRASSRTLLLTLAGLLAFGIGIGGSLGIAGVVAGHDDPTDIHACVHPFSGVMRYVTDPATCAYYEQVVSWDAAGAAGMTYAVRTSIKAVPANAGGLASNEAHCEPGEIAISGGSRALIEGRHMFTGSVEFDHGGGPTGTPPTGWVEGYSFAHTQPDLSVETWVLCVS